MNYYFLFSLFMSRGFNFHCCVFHKAPKVLLFATISLNNLPEISDLRNSTFEIFTCKPMYLSHAAYQSAFFLCISAPDPLGRPCFLIIGFPFNTGCFVDAAVLDSVFVTNDEDKDC